ncbi:hypothetical protein KDW36_16215 [Burkholderia dolosa]|uniref:hypothetical protein n=1 Tax=Burkholderia dolosa TaxID=152500 RepID=UPI001BA01128|nr:hypothetical protein [Burkholderia dolosa]MBR8314730.1 hypothetical protein [Burkholderia dolosa]
MYGSSVDALRSSRRSGATALPNALQAASDEQTFVARVVAASNADGPRPYTDERYSFASPSTTTLLAARCDDLKDRTARSPGNARRNNPVSVAGESKLSNDTRKFITDVVSVAACPSESSGVPPLHELAAGVAVGRIVGAGAPAFALQLCEEIVREVPLLADVKHSVKLALLPHLGRVAQQRVCDGESCTTVAAEHRIPLSGSAFRALEMSAVEGVAREWIRSGTSCALVADRHGIRKNDSAIHSAFEKLQAIAVADGPARLLVLEGRSCRKVAQQYGIRLWSQAFARLEMLAVRRHAKRHLLKGKSCDEVVELCGIRRQSDAFRELQTIAARIACKRSQRRTAIDDPERRRASDTETAQEKFRAVPIAGDQS